MATEKALLQKTVSNEVLTRLVDSLPLMESTTSNKRKPLKNDFFKDKFGVRSAIQTGIPNTIFELIQSYTSLTDTDWAGILDISTKSLKRYRNQEEYNFKASHSEKIIEILEVTSMGLDVFGDMDKFKLWMNTPNFALRSLKPIELLKDSYGKELIIGELTRINYGIFI